MKIQVLLHEESVDTLAMMMIGYVLHMPKEDPKYQEKVEVVTEFLEETMDPSFGSVACYLTVLNLMPETVKRRIPFRIEEFINMYEHHIEEALGGEIPSKYKPKRIIEQPKVILGADGSIVSEVSDTPPPKLQLV